RATTLLALFIVSPVTSVFFTQLAVVCPFFATPFPLQAGFRFVAEFNFRALPFHIGQHEPGVTKGAADEIFLAGLRVPDETRRTEHRHRNATGWVVAGLQLGLLAGR